MFLDSLLEPEIPDQRQDELGEVIDEEERIDPCVDAAAVGAGDDFALDAPILVVEFKSEELVNLTTFLLDECLVDLSASFREGRGVEAHDDSANMRCNQAVQNRCQLTLSWREGVQSFFEGPIGHACVSDSTLTRPR